MIFAGCGGEIIQDIAAARRDGDDPVMRLKLQRIQIDAGIFPDLVIDKALKHQGKKPLQDAPRRGRRRLDARPVPEARWPCPASP